jgi:hypothetical protein
VVAIAIPDLAKVDPGESPAPRHRLDCADIGKLELSP